MFRVVTRYKNPKTGWPVVEKGPWHAARSTAEHWADVMRAMGYHTVVEQQRGGAGKAVTISTADYASSVLAGMV